MADKSNNKGLLGWFAGNHVAANLLMLLIIVGGILSIIRIKVEIFPDMDLDMITVSVPHLGASPAEVEDGVVIRVEEAISGVEGIKRLRSVASEGMGTVTAEVEEFADSRKVLDDIKAAVDRIITFPEETEKPIVSEVTTRNRVMTLVLYGDASEKSLKYLAQRMRDDLTAMENISQVDISGTRRFEISIEVSEEKKVAQVHCRGGRKRTKLQFEYDGIEDCNALFILYHGDKECKYGCLGKGSCIDVCPVDAIDYDEEGLVWVDRETCISCGKCIDVCPTGVMKWIPYDADYMVACNSTDKGGAVKKYCEVGCIGCKICEKKSPEGVYVVENFLSKIDYSKEGDRSAGAAACPTNCIIRLDKNPIPKPKKEEARETKKTT